jgi:hypothetical protein
MAASHRRRSNHSQADPFEFSSATPKGPSNPLGLTGTRFQPLADAHAQKQPGVSLTLLFNM